MFFYGYIFDGCCLWPIHTDTIMACIGKTQYLILGDEVPMPPFLTNLLVYIKWVGITNHRYRMYIYSSGLLIVHLFNNLLPFYLLAQRSVCLFHSWYIWASQISCTFKIKVEIKKIDIVAPNDCSGYISKSIQFH